MALVQSSPWLDAASYGQGLGQALGQVLLQLPAVRANVAQQLAQAQLNNRQFGLQQAQYGLEQQRMAEQQRQFGQQFGFQQTQERNRAGEEQRRLDIQKQQADAMEAMRSAQAENLKSQAAERTRSQELGNELAFQYSQPVAGPEGALGPRMATPESLQMQILSQDPSAMARVLAEQEVARVQATKVPAEKRYLMSNDGRVFDTQTQSWIIAPEAAPKPYNLLSSQVYDTAAKGLSGPDAMFMSPAVSNSLMNVLQLGNQLMGATNDAPPQQVQSQIPTVASQVDFDKLKSGDVYIGTDGKKYRKP